MTTDVGTLLEERGSRYGTFKGHAELTQSLKNTLAPRTLAAQGKLRGDN